MALLECTDCASAMSTSAEACPHCGFRQTTGPRQTPGPIHGLRILWVLLAYALVTIGLMYAMPSYALVLAVVLVVCAVVEIRGGLVRRLLPTG